MLSSSDLRRFVRAVLVVLGVLLGVGTPGLAWAEQLPSGSTGKVPATDAQDLSGKNLERIDVVFDQPLWEAPVTLTRVRVGQTYTPELARRALDELAGTGRYGELRAEVEPFGNGVLLRLHVVARRLVAGVRVNGVSDPDELLRSADIRPGSEITATDLARMVKKLEEELSRRGYPHALVRAETIETDDPLEMLLIFEITPGVAARISERRFLVWPDPKAPKLGRLLARHKIGRGAVANIELIESASNELEQMLRTAGYFDARVEHELVPGPAGPRLDVKVYAGSLVVVSFEGIRRFDESDLLQALDLETQSDRSASALAERIRDFYEARGFLDVEVEPLFLGAEGAPVRRLVLRVFEGELVRVVSREYPCLSAERTADEVGSEIDSFLSELPGGTLIDAVDPRTVDALFGPHGKTGARPRPLFLNPWSVYSPEIYERAAEHLQDLFRSEGYLSAAVGPVTLLRHTCDVRSPPGRCIPKPVREVASFECRYDESGLPIPDPLIDPALTCRANRARGERCSPEAVVRMPIKLGPRSYIERVETDGNREISDDELLEATGLTWGAPVSQVELDRARRNLLDLYAEEGYAFADVELDLVLSNDRRRATVRFVISERKQVRVARVVVKGARATSESVIRRRIGLEEGGIYRRSLVRTTEERLGALGVFSSVTVGLEDPYVPASRKVVIVTVQERKPQYLDVRPGFSTGEGFRITFEYGHRNLTGNAIQLTLRSQLGFLPTALIFQDSVRRKYEELDALERLERRNTATVEFPDIGLGPLFRLRVEGVDVRDNARDYGLTKDAGILSLFFLPERRLWLELGGSLERNDASIFGEEGKAALNDYIQDNPNQRNAFRVPEGPTFVVAERIGVTWDRRDSPLDATSGTFFSAGVEHVNARPIGEGCPDAPQLEVDPFQPSCSQFLRFTSRIAGYVRLSGRGLALAASFRFGLNHQLRSGSRTYPDRLFFLGGVDSLRGFLQEALVPEDLAQRLLTDPEFDINSVVIRGGDVFLNPRLELRIPLLEDVQTALFLDTGNLWTDVDALEVFKLRYAVGTGLRIGTPVGPLVFDYGFNVTRVLDALGLTSGRQRYWEDIGAFHFSIGLF